MPVRCVILLLFIISLPTFSADKKLIAVYFYHAKPPLLINQTAKLGLYFDFVKYLNSRSELYQFELVYMPRKRINNMLQQETLQGLVVGVNPTWFKDKKETKYFWTSRLFTDRDEVISLNSKPITFDSPKSLHGLVFGGVRGFYYFGIDEAIAQNHIRRVDTADEVSLFSMLQHQRIDAAVVSRSTFNYVIRENNWHSVYHLSKRPHDIYDRRVLVPKSQFLLYQHVEKLMSDMAFNQDWQLILDHYF